MLVASASREAIVASAGATFTRGSTATSASPRRRLLPPPWAASLSLPVHVHTLVACRAQAFVNLNRAPKLLQTYQKVANGVRMKGIFAKVEDMLIVNQLNMGKLEKNVRLPTRPKEAVLKRIGTLRKSGKLDALLKLAAKPV